jgi:hypothetical protein
VQWDELFSQGFDVAVVFGGTLAVVLVPFVIPHMLRYRHWWLVDPLKRWLYLSVGITALLGLLFVWAPYLAQQGWLPAAVGVMAYRGVPVEYFQCQPDKVDFEARGVLWGWLGKDRSAALYKTSLLGSILAIPLVAGGLVYLIIYRLIERIRGLRAPVRAQGQTGL